MIGKVHSSMAMEMPKASILATEEADDDVSMDVEEPAVNGSVKVPTLNFGVAYS